VHFVGTVMVFGTQHLSQSLPHFVNCCYTRFSMFVINWDRQNCHEHRTKAIQLSNKHTMTELAVICATAGDDGSRMTSHVVSTRFVITNHKTSKSRTSRLYLRRDTVPG